MSSRQRGALQEERRVTQQFERVDKNTPAAADSEQAVRRQSRRNPGVFIQPCPASSPSCFPSRGAVGMQPLLWVSPGGLHPGPYPNTTSGLVRLHFSSEPSASPAAPYLSRQAMGSAAKPRHMLRAGHPGIQQLIGSSRGWQGAATGGGDTTCPAVLCWRLRQRRGAALYIGWEAGERGGRPGIAPASSQPKAAQAAPVKSRA